MNSVLLALTASEVSLYYRERLPELRQTRTHEWRGGCPVHLGRDPNFAVRADTGAYFCFSQCGAGGSLYDLELILYGGLFLEARNRVWDIVGRPLPQLSREEKQAWAEQRKRDEADEMNAAYWHRGALLSLEQILEVNKQRLFDADGEPVEHVAQLVRRDTRREAELRTLSQAGRLARYREQRQTDPLYVALMVRLGREDLEDIETEAAVWVRMLEQRQGRTEP